MNTVQGAHHVTAPVSELPRSPSGYESILGVRYQVTAHLDHLGITRRPDITATPG